MLNMKMLFKSYLDWIFNFKKFEFLKNFSFLFLRLFSGYFMAVNHGYSKITSSQEKWVSLGEKGMAIFGFDSGVMIFGFLAALSESLLSVFICLGLLTRPSSLMVSLTMFFAGSYHLGKGDSPESAFLYMSIFIFIFINGPGKFSLDQLLIDKNIIKF